MTFDLFQAGAWPIGQSNLPSFSIPQELEKSVQMVSRPPLLYGYSHVSERAFVMLLQN